MMDRGKVARAALATVEGGAAGTMADARHDAASPCAASGVSDTREGDEGRARDRRAVEALDEAARIVRICCLDGGADFEASWEKRVGIQRRRARTRPQLDAASPVPAVADDPACDCSGVGWDKDGCPVHGAVADDPEPCCAHKAFHGWCHHDLEAGPGSRDTKEPGA
jgi:hypothetical protein